MAPRKEENVAEIRGMVCLCVENTSQQFDEVNKTLNVAFHRLQLKCTMCTRSCLCILCIC